MHAGGKGHLRLLGFGKTVQSDTLRGQEARELVMDADDVEPRKKVAERRNLEPMSVEDLNAYIGELEAEIERVRNAIAAKKSVRSGAESLFRR
jgi:uncharacterized small protein (DUF1192 family)